MALIPARVAASPFTNRFVRMLTDFVGMMICMVDMIGICVVIF